LQYLISIDTIGNSLELGVHSLAVGDHNLLRMVLEQVQEVWRVGGDHDLHRLALVASVFRVSQSVQSVLNPAQQPWMDAAIGPFQ